ncbi:hypothetical protein [Aliarcobacter butzleri]|uniref:hypothetical protein n=1 Tax=Aliarcobacter butzleri TaxID=28197 RepID=UPI00186AB9B1|nr:hypothetical protein [Aliarcobacter butzleri]MCG3668470.1 hypothetical protein [Aliarcobacter butzleri]
MNNMVVKILELFKHISRDIMIYVIPGFIIVVNLFIIDELYLNNKILGLIEKLEYLSFIIFILTYVIGHIIMALMEIVQRIVKCINLEKNNVFKVEVKIFKKNKELYDYFIERQNQLSYFRWTLSGAFIISSIINIFYKYIEKVNISLYFIFLPLIIGISLLILHYVTEKEYKEKVNTIKTLYP